MDRRAFLGGVVTGAVAGIGTYSLRRPAEPPAPPPAPPPQPAGPLIPEHGRISFSQQGEDLLLYHLCHDLLKIESPTYLDVGAAYPVRGNNTYLLYYTGARGVLVEPNPALTAQLREVRPRDTVVEAGIGVTAQAEADYYEIIDNPMLNTFSAEQVATLEKERGAKVVARVVKMPLININEVIATHLGKAPDVLSTDVEGLDYDILKSLDLSRFRPGIICAESALSLSTGATSPVVRLLTSRGYRVTCATMYNVMCVDGRRLTS